MKNNDMKKENKGLVKRNRRLSRENKLLFVISLFLVVIFNINGVYAESSSEECQDTCGCPRGCEEGVCDINPEMEPREALLESGLCKSGCSENDCKKCGFFYKKEGCSVCEFRKKDGLLGLLGVGDYYCPSEECDCPEGYLCSYPEEKPKRKLVPIELFPKKKLVPVPKCVPEKDCLKDETYFDIEKCKEDFEGYTGTKLEFKLGDAKNIITKQNVDKEIFQRYISSLCEFYRNLPVKKRESIKKIYFYSDYFFRLKKGFSAGGSADRKGSGEIVFNEKYYSFINEGSGRHESTHVLHIQMRVNEGGWYKDSRFDKEWKSIAGDIYGIGKIVVKIPSADGAFYLCDFVYKEDAGKSKEEREKLCLIPKYGIVYPFGAYEDLEDVATFVETVNREPKFFATYNLLNPINPWHKVYRGKLDLLLKYNFISQKEYDKVLIEAGLKKCVCDDESCSLESNKNR